MADLTPRTRSESFLNGEDLEPITRREHFYAGRENELPEGHQEPETREEWFIKKYREAGDVTVESLSITENGTYTAPSGKAYSPVSVNVPLPSNAYLLQTIEHESIATFTDGTDNFLKSLEVAIEPQQDLHGYDAPWVGGSGKNKMPLSFTDGSQTNGITIHKNNDGTVKITGKATAQAVITIGEYTTPIAQSIKYSGAVGGGASTYSVNIAVNGGYNYSDVYDGDSTAVNVSANDVIREVIVVRSGYECPTSGIIFYPMVRNSAESSTFAPYSNICPISGWDKVNVSDSISINEEIESGTLTSDGMNGSSSTRIRTKNYISVKPNTTYVVDWDSDSITYFGLKGYTVNDFTTASIQGSDWIAKGSTITTDANVNYIRTNFRNNSNTNVSPSEMSKLRVTPISNYYTIDLDGTRYGGTLDVVSGVLTVDRVTLDLGSRTYNKSSDGYFYCFTTDLNFVSFDKDNPNAECEIYKLCTYAEYTIKTVYSAIFGNNNSHVIYIADSRFTDVNDLKTALNGVKLVYELATPLTIQLTPTAIKSFQGDNNFFASTGEIDFMQYWGEVS